MKQVESKEMERKEENEDKLDMVDTLVSEAENMGKELEIVNLNECSEFVSDNVVNLLRQLYMKEICLINGRGKNFSNISVQERGAVGNL